MMMEQQALADKLIRNGMAEVKFPDWGGEYHRVDLMFRHEALVGEDPHDADPGLVYNVVSDEILEMGYTMRYTAAQWFIYTPPEGYPEISIASRGVSGLDIRVGLEEKWDYSLLETLLPALLKDFSLDLD